MNPIQKMLWYLGNIWDYGLQMLPLCPCGRGGIFLSAALAQKAPGRSGADQWSLGFLLCFWAT